MSDSASSGPPSSSTLRKSGRYARLWLVLRLMVCITLVVVLCRSANLAETARTLYSASLPLVAAAGAVALADRSLMGYKWNLLLRRRRIFVSTLQAVRLYLVGHVLGTVSPGSIGGDAYRVAALSPLGKTPAVLSTILLERLIGVAVVATAAAVLLPLSAQFIDSGSTSLAWLTIPMAVAAVGGLLVSLSPWIVEGVGRRIPYFSRTSAAARVRNWYRVYAEYRSDRRILVIFTVLTIAELFTLVVLNYLAARAVGLDVSFAYFLCVMPLLHLLVRLPVSFQGIGVQEGLFVYFLVAAGFTPAQGLSVSLLHRGLDLFCTIPCGVAMWWLIPLHLEKAGGRPNRSDSGPLAEGSAESWGCVSDRAPGVPPPPNSQA